MLRHHRGPDALGQTFQMREKLASIGKDFWIEDANGSRLFKVDHKVLRVRDTIHLEGVNGEEVAKIRQKLVHLRETMEIERGGDVIAKVKKRRLGIRQHFLVEVHGHDDLAVTGNIVEHEYEITRDHQVVARVSKAWFRVRETYGVSIAEDQDTGLILAVTVCLDQMSRDD